MITTEQTENETAQINPTRTIGQAAPETAALTKFLEGIEVGQVVTYQQMKAACKADVQVHNSFLQTARRNLLKQRMAFGTISGVGIKRLADFEMPDEAKSKQERARRMAKRGIAIIDCADIGKLDQETKIRAITTKTVLGLMAGVGARKLVNLTEQAARNGEMKVGNLEDLFRK